MRTLTLLFFAAIVLAASPPTLKSKPGEAPTLDGTVDADEWGDGKELRIRHDKQHVYVAVVAKSGITTLFVESDKKVLALHSSATIGTAVYKKTEEGYAAEREFAYKKPSDEFFKKEHWRATTMRDGQAGHVEFQISRKLFGKAKKIRLAAYVVRGGPPAMAWPKGLKDGTTNAQLLFGKTPGELQFDPKTWGVVELAKQ